ncbi:MAG: hypothetical protein AB1553_15805 [Nitrospirota bacterium]
MKTLLVACILLVVAVAAGYFGIPFLLESATSGIRADVERLKQQVRHIEAFVRAEEEARKTAVLQPDADTQKIVKAVNTLASRTAALEGSLARGLAATEETQRKQSEAYGAAFKKQAEDLQKISFDARLAALRGHMAKMRADLLAKNIATAKSEMELIDGTLERMKAMVAGDRKKGIEELQATLRKTRTEADTNQSAALSRVDLLWHETSKMLMSTP